MKNTGMSRRIDELGRIVIPAEIRKSLDIQDKEALDVSVEADRIVLSKRAEVCVFCGSGDDLKEFKLKMICVSCLAELTGDAPAGEGWGPGEN